MRSVVVITNQPLDIHTLADAYKTSGHVDIQSDERLVIEGEWGWFAFNRDKVLEEEFDEAELDELRRQVDAPSFAQLEYSNSRAADIAILGLPVNGTTLIDNDHGLIAPVGEIRRRIQEGAGWHSDAR
jgi:hypothetical protein